VSTVGTPGGIVVSKFLKRLPVFSPVAVKLMGVVAKEDVSFKEVANLISLDPALSGETLRMANSGLYARRQEIVSVLHAIAIVGLQRLTQIVVTAALWRGIPNRTSPFMKAWWRHSVATALIGDQTAVLPVDHALHRRPAPRNRTTGAVRARRGGLRPAGERFGYGRPGPDG
jgi:hypothetical protein